MAQCEIYTPLNDQRIDSSLLLCPNFREHQSGRQQVFFFLIYLENLVACESSAIDVICNKGLFVK